MKNIAKYMTIKIKLSTYFFIASYNFKRNAYLYDFSL